MIDYPNKFNDIVSWCLRNAHKLCINHLSSNCVFIKVYPPYCQTSDRFKYEYESLCVKNFVSADDIVKDLTSFSQKGQFVSRIKLTLYFSTPEQNVFVVELFFADKEAEIDFDFLVPKTISNLYEDRIDVNDYVKDIFEGRVKLPGVEGLRPW